MSALFRTCIGSLAAGLCCLPLSGALAQQSANPSAQSNQPQSRPATSTRGDQATAPRLNPQSTSQAQPHTANYGSQANDAQHNAVGIYFANCLLKNNQAEIEISQFAAQKTQNPKVKQFAEELVKDHQQVVQKLQPIANAATQGSGSSSLDTAAAQNESNRSTADTTRTPGSSGTDTAARDTASATSSGNSATHGDAQLMQVAQIEEKINDRCNQMLREELQQKSGTEFDECYLGAQVAGHMHMLAALEVLPDESQGQLKQIAEDAKPIVQKHLEQAKDLMKQLKSGDNSNQAERSTTRSQR